MKGTVSPSEEFKRAKLASAEGERIGNCTGVSSGVCNLVPLHGRMCEPGVATWRMIALEGR
jgi:hypothetical protein